MGRNVILVMGSNVGSKRILDMGANAKNNIDDDDDDDIHDIYTQMNIVVKEELEHNFKPEFINRIDDVVTFSPLQTKHLKNIAQLLLDDTIQRAKKERNVDFTYSQHFLSTLIESGSSTSMSYGARPMRRSIQRYFEDTVSDAILNGFLNDGEHAYVDISLSTSKKSSNTIDDDINDDTTTNTIVEICRLSDNEKYFVPVETYGAISIGTDDSSDSTTTVINGSTTTTTTETTTTNKMGKKKRSRKMMINGDNYIPSTDTTIS